MSTIESLESLHEALQPLGTHRTENDDLGGWIHDSFAALEKLHEELTQWQSELARKETELNLRADALDKTPRTESERRQQLAALEEELVTVQERARALEEQNNEQLLEFEELEGKYAKLKSELHVAQKRVGQLEITLDLERQRAEVDKEHWEKEFRELHSAIDRYNARLLTYLEGLSTQGEASDSAGKVPPASVRTLAQNSQFRHQAQPRRKTKK